jgi:hypothetical protein
LVKLKGNKCGVTGVIWHALKKREKEGNLLAVTIDEFTTSRVCNIRYEDSFEKKWTVSKATVFSDVKTVKHCGRETSMLPRICCLFHH